MNNEIKKQIKIDNRNNNKTFLALSPRQRGDSLSDESVLSSAIAEEPCQNAFISFEKFYCCSYCAISVTIFFLSFFTAAAQFVLPNTQMPNLNMQSILSLAIDTRTPTPNSVVTATANLSGINNVGNANYTWFLNGVKKGGSSGANKNTFTFQVGNLGAIYNVSATVAMSGGNNLSDSISLTVGDVDLTWGTTSQAPALYRGKPLPTRKSIVNISALPLIYQPGTKSSIGSGNLIFDWRLDDKFVLNKSGQGKSEFSFVVDDFAGSSKSLRLEIKTPNGAVSMAKTIDIPIVRPQTFIYFADTETGTPYGAALKNLITAPMRLNFIAQNYFFNAPNQDLDWQWTLNGKGVTGANEKPWLASLDLNNVGGLSSLQIQATAKNKKDDLEMAQSIINLQVK